MRALLLLLCLGLATPAAAQSVPPVLDAATTRALRDALARQGVTLGDLGSVDRGQGSATHPTVASALADPRTAPQAAQEWASAVAMDAAATPDRHWAGALRVIGESWQVEPAAGDCVAPETTPLSSQHIAASEAAGQRWSKRERNDLAQRLNPDLDRTLGALAAAAERAACQVQAALGSVPADQRAALLVEAERWLGDDMALPAPSPATDAVLAAWQGVDRAALLGAARGWLSAIDAATQKLVGLDAAAWPQSPLIWQIGLGEVWIGSMGANAGAGNPVLLVDPGGDDHWRIRPEARSAADGVLLPVRGWIDLGGDDVWRSGALGPGGAAFGVAAGVDLAGDDVHQGGSLGAGAGVFGVGSWLDVAGRDRYDIGEGGQGFGLAGAGILRDQRRDDIYRADRWAQGASLPGGVGVLHDQRGGDRFLLTDDVREDREFEAVQRSLLLADCHAGCGQGFSAGLRGLADGGLGMLVDDGGDDLYSASERAQGAARWRGIGVARDGGGDDQWIGGRYVQASADEGSVAVLLDTAGSDRYFATHGAVGWAGADSVAWLLDLNGIDRFTVEAQGLGSTTASNALALLVDGDGWGNYSVVRGGSPGTRRPSIASIVSPQVVPPSRVITGMASGSSQRLSAGEIQALITALDGRREDALLVVDAALSGRTEPTQRERESLVQALSVAAERTVGTDAPRWILGWMVDLTRRTPLLAGTLEATASELLTHESAVVREAAWDARYRLSRVEGLTMAPDEALRISTEAAVALQNEAHADVRAAAARAAGAFGEAGVASSLVDALLTEHLALRRSAEAALLAVAACTDGMGVARGLWGAASGEESVDPVLRAAALRVLGASEQREAVDILVAALADPFLELAAVEGLARHGSRTARAALEPWVQAHPDSASWVRGLLDEE